MAAGLVLGGTAAAGLVIARDRVGDDAVEASSEPTVPVETALVERRDLVESEDFDGTLGYGPETDIDGSGGGTITSLPFLGSTIERGVPLWEVDGGAGPRLMYGDRPMWRELRRGVDDGADVRQLEENLLALGHAPEGMVVDEEFDADTASAVKAWQESNGVKATGVVGVGDVVFAEGPRRVSGHHAAVGDPSDGEVLATTGTSQVVTLAVPADDVGRFAGGDELEVELPDGTRVDGVVWSVASVADTDDQGVVTLEVIVALRQPVEALDAAPVEVVLTDTVASGVLVVPFRALLALSEGGYAVEKLTAGGTELVGVELGVTGDGVVEIRGDVQEGDQVVVAL